MKKLQALLLCLLVLPATFESQVVNYGRMQSGVNEQTGTSYAFVSSDVNKLVTFNNVLNIAATLPSGLTPGFGVGTIFAVSVLGTGSLTITCTGCNIKTAAGAATTLVIPQGSGALLYGDGINFSAQVIGATAPGGSAGVAGASGEWQVNNGGILGSLAGSSFTGQDASIGGNLTVGSAAGGTGTVTAQKFVASCPLGPCSIDLQSTAGAPAPAAGCFGIVRVSVNQSTGALQTCVPLSLGGDATWHALATLPLTSIFPLLGPAGSGTAATYAFAGHPEAGLYVSQAAVAIQLLSCTADGAGTTTCYTYDKSTVLVSAVTTFDITGVANGGAGHVFSGTGYTATTSAVNPGGVCTGTVAPTNTAYVPSCGWRLTFAQPGVADQIGTNNGVATVIGTLKEWGGHLDKHASFGRIISDSTNPATGDCSICLALTDPITARDGSNKSYWGGTNFTLLQGVAAITNEAGARTAVGDVGGIQLGGPLWWAGLAKGDLLVGQGGTVGSVRLPVGADAFVLTADSTQATGLKWAAGGGGGSPAFSAVTAGTNPAALLMGTGGSLTTSGTGIINATALHPANAGTYIPVTGTNPTLDGSGGKLIFQASDGGVANIGGILQLTNSTSGVATAYMLVGQDGPQAGPAANGTTFFTATGLHGFHLTGNGPIDIGDTSQGTAGKLSFLGQALGGSQSIQCSIATTTCPSLLFSSVDASGATAFNLFKLPVVAGGTATANGACGYDSTNNNLHCANTAADAVVPVTTITPVDGHMVQWSVSSGSFKLKDLPDVPLCKSLSPASVVLAGNPVSNTIFSCTIPANYLGTDGCVEAHATMHKLSGANATLYAWQVTGSSATVNSGYGTTNLNGNGSLSGRLCNNASASAQTFWGTTMLTGTGITTGTGNSTATHNSTSSMNFNLVVVTTFTNGDTIVPDSFVVTKMRQ